MKKVLNILFFCMISSFSYAQIFDVEPILYNGDDNKHINFVILSDGYQESELDQFISDATNIVDEMFTISPYKEYKSYFNIYAVKVPSNESGASHPGTANDVTEPQHPVMVVDNYFGSTFDHTNVHRLLIPTNSTAIYSVLEDNFPAYDQVIVLINTPYYGGSGGDYASTGLNSSSNHIILHELGHSFASLKDEYWYNANHNEGINRTQESNPTLVKWKNWIGDNGIGIYLLGTTPLGVNWYKPHQSCIMGSSELLYCSVCIEGIIEKIHGLVSPILDFTPVNLDILNPTYPINFELNLTEPNPNTLDIEWMLNGTEIYTDVNNIQINENELNEGVNTIIATVVDNSPLLRINEHETIHFYTVTWIFDKNSLGIDDFISSSYNDIIKIYPNPTIDNFLIKLENNFDNDISLELYTLNGQLLKKVNLNFNNLTEINIEILASGIYILKFIKNNYVILSKKIIKI